MPSTKIGGIFVFMEDAAEEVLFSQVETYLYTNSKRNV